MIEVVELPFLEAKKLVQSPNNDKTVNNYDATFLYLIYWFLYNKETSLGLN